MSVTVGEKKGREVDGSSGTIIYVAICDDGETESDVITEVYAIAPSSYNGLSRALKPKLSEIAFDTDTGFITHWLVEVPYGSIRARLVPPETGTVEWEGTTAGGTQHIGSPIALVFAYTDPDISTLPSEWGTSIGATKDSIAGTDIVVPVHSFRARKYISSGSFPTLLSNAYALTGKTNDDTWTGGPKTYAAGEVLCLGIESYRLRTEVTPHDYEISIGFASSPNVTGITIGGITDIDKKGWEYLDCTYQTTEDGGFLFQKLIVASVMQVYEEGNFGALGL